MQHTKNQTAFLTTALITLTTLFYLPSLWYGYIFDDKPRIASNFYLNIFRPSKIIFSGTRWISELLNHTTYHLFKLNPFWYRSVNLAIHIASGVMLFYLFKKVLARFPVPFIKAYAPAMSCATAGFFLLHPVQTQTVTYITQMRLEGVATFFAIAVISLFVKATEQSRPLYTWLYVACAALVTALASGSKEIIVVLPILMALFDWFFVSHASWAKVVRNAPIHVALAAVLYGFFATYPQPVSVKEAVTFSAAAENNRGNRITLDPYQAITPGTYFISQFKVIQHYISIFFWPFSLSFDYDIRLSQTFWQRDVIGPLLFLLLLLACAAGMFFINHLNLFSFATAWFFTAVLPRASIIPSPELVCDYKTYLASIGVHLLFGIGTVWLALAAIKMARAAAVLGVEQKLLLQAALVLVCMPLGYASYRCNSVWSSPVAFWKNVTTVAPNKARAFNNLAVGYSSVGDIHGAIDTYLQATRVDPNYAEPHINLAFHYQNLGDRRSALKHYQLGLDLVQAAHPEMYYNLGRFNMEGKDYKRAKNCFKIATSLRPYYSKAHFALGKIHLLQGNKEEAERSFQAACQGDLPAHEIFYSLGQLCYETKQWDKAIAALERIYMQHPFYKQTAFMLGSAYYQKADYIKATTYFEQACHLDATDAVYRYNCAQAHLKAGNFTRALALFNACDATQPSFAYAPLHAAKCYEQLGETDQARATLQAYLDGGPFEKIREQAETILSSLTALSSYVPQALSPRSVQATH